MTFDIGSAVFFLCYVAVTTAYGLYMKRQGILLGISDTLIALSDSKSELIRDAMKALEDKAERKYRDK